MRMCISLLANKVVSSVSECPRKQHSVAAYMQKPQRGWSIEPSGCPDTLLNQSLSNVGADLNDTIQAPVVVLYPVKNLSALFAEIRLATLVGDLREENGLPDFVVALARSGLFSLLLLEFLLDCGGLGELLCRDSLGHAIPKRQRLTLGLLLLGWEDLGRNVEWVEVDNDSLILGWVRVLEYTN